MLKRIKIGYDDNLGLPTDFAETIGCDIVAFHDLDKMLQSYNAKELSAMFLPVGALPYLKNYNILSQSILSLGNKITLKTDFVSALPISIADIPQKMIGRVNQYCTTSFWAPLICFMSYFPQGTELHFINTDGFQDMLHKVAEKKIDCAMVWDIILHQNAKDANQVKILFCKDDLPSPVIIGHEGFDTAIQEKINQFRTTDKDAFFKGFQAVNQDMINSFLKDIEKVTNYFSLSTNDS